jgi:hypothetical protein
MVFHPEIHEDYFVPFLLSFCTELALVFFWLLVSSGVGAFLFFPFFIFFELVKPMG